MKYGYNKKRPLIADIDLDHMYHKDVVSPQCGPLCAGERPLPQ